MRFIQHFYLYNKEKEKKFLKYEKNQFETLLFY